MRIVSWNCRGAFSEKFRFIEEKYNSDIYIIQECENPLEDKSKEYKKFANNYIWAGFNKNRGLGIFAKDTIKLKDNNWETYGLEWFISCTINDCLTLLGVWASGNYIEDIYVYLQIYKEKLKNANNILIGGDFNSNKCWDKRHKRRNYSAVVKQLEEQKLYSCYHFKENEIEGQESRATFYMHKKKEKPYHIDYFFYSKEKVKSIEIGNFEDWKSLSDHMPIVLDINNF